MPGLVIAIIAIATLLVVVLGYWVLLMARYPEPARASEVHIVTTKDGWRLRLQRRRALGGKGEPVLLVHGAASNSTGFLEPAGNSLSDTLIERGFDCWLLDLRICRSATPPPGKGRGVSADDLLDQDLPCAISYICEITGYPKLHYVGHSMGGMMLYAYAVVYGAERIASAATLTSPVGFDDASYRGLPLVAQLARISPALCGFIYRAAGPLFMPLRISNDALPINYDNLHPDVDAGVFVNLIEAPPRRFLLETNKWATEHEWLMRAGQLDMKTRLHSLDFPLYAFFAAQDPFLTEERAHEFFSALKSKDKRISVLSVEDGCAEDYGHIDIIMAKNGREEVFEPIADWFDHHAIGKTTAAAEKRREPDAPFKASSKKAAAAKKKSAARQSDARRPSAKKSASVNVSDARKPAAKKAPAARKATTTRKAAKPSPVKKEAAAKKKPAAGKKASPRER